MPGGISAALYEAVLHSHIYVHAGYIHIYIYIYWIHTDAMITDARRKTFLEKYLPLFIASVRKGLLKVCV